MKMKFKKLNPHQLAVVQALFVAFLWSTSWVLIKIGLVEIPPLTFAGLRYTLGFIFLLLWLVRKRRLREVRAFRRADWIGLAVLGVLLYSITQGAQFIGLAHLPSASVNLIISFTAIVVALAGIVFLREVPTLLQWCGIGLSLIGAVIYFTPLFLPKDKVFAIIVVFTGMLACSAAAVLGRRINLGSELSPALVTVVSMGIGGILLLGVGATLQGIPPIGIKGWLIITWLALVNTAFTFTLYNLTLRTLPVAESSLITNTMIFQIPILAWVFLGESISMKGIAGLLIFGAGLALVQLGHKGKHTARAQPEGKP